MTALSTSLALPLWPHGQQILIAIAVYKCMTEQYWNKKLPEKAWVSYV